MNLLKFHLQVRPKTLYTTYSCFPPKRRHISVKDWKCISRWTYLYASNAHQTKTIYIKRKIYKKFATWWVMIRQFSGMHKHRCTLDLVTWDALKYFSILKTSDSCSKNIDIPCCNTKKTIHLGKRKKIREAWR